MVPWFPILARLGHRCAGGDFSGCNHDPTMCAQHKRTWQGVEWSTCPVREVLDDPAVDYICRLDQHAKVMPLSGWPARYAAWVPDALADLRREQDAARAQAEREARL